VSRVQGHLELINISLDGLTEEIRAVPAIDHSPFGQLIIVSAQLRLALWALIIGISFYAVRVYASVQSELSISKCLCERDSPLTDTDSVAGSIELISALACFALVLTSVIPCNISAGFTRNRNSLTSFRVSPGWISPANKSRLAVSVMGAFVTYRSGIAGLAK